VLIYPEIGMDQKTVQLACMRLAPVQIAAWGHPVTSGLPTIDYFLSAQALEPAGACAHYTEQLVALPNLGVYYEPPVAVASTEPTSRAGAQTTPVLLCAGTPFKYAPEHDRVLVDIARRLGPCQFHFFQHADGALSRRLLQRLGSAFIAAGLDPAAHLVLRPLASADEFHALLRTADLMLDTIGFSGFNTVMRALACQLPVVSCRGRFLRGRLGSGILDLIDLSALVADSPQGYVDIAVSLARRCAERDALRTRLAERVPSLYRDRTAVTALEAFLIERVDRIR
jgi:predicted O-linked N-acetylglucosamine transferase (SPINDLY family)